MVNATFRMARFIFGSGLDACHLFTLVEAVVGEGEGGPMVYEYVSLAPYRRRSASSSFPNCISLDLGGEITNPSLFTFLPLLEVVGGFIKGLGKDSFW